MIEGTSTAPLLLLGLVLLLPVLLLPQLKGWIRKSSPPANRLLDLRFWRWHPKQSTEIISLRMYPIKSCRGFEVQRATVKEHGLELDRRWMLIDASKNEFVTIRQTPKMTLIGTALSPDGNDLIISIPRQGLEPAETVGASSDPQSDATTNTIRIPAFPTRKWLQDNTSVADVKIWGHDTDGYIYGDEINAAFSSFLGYPVALVYKGPKPRVVQGNGSPERVGRVQSINFPDEFPVLVASDASLNELNTRLLDRGADPITIERFRPNIIVRGEKPWSEDLWKLVRIKAIPSTDSSDDDLQEDQAPLLMDIVTRCGRCQVPNVDPDSAVKNKKQPWDTLMSFRRVDAGLKYKPCFGMMGMPRKEGIVEVGMRFEVLEETTEHRYIM
ncbi:Molybdenum cofactor sulfurase C-terminal [Penicillium angulare]|uniref:Molybdenum cofactor sulfurase C-terminal n=1 Tax=Penicillium angulare TaxID=116970 RepID=A0A9W9EV29_9EURO|nr:Molybdenum cofactor sulfurase C-terminal [Penicillium angulare]